MQIRQAEQHMQTSLWGIANKASRDSRHRFGNLYSLLNEKNLHWCFGEMNKKASAGIDDVDYHQYEANLDANIKDLVSDLKTTRYRASLVRRKNISKGDGKYRPLGIPVVTDKLLQTAVAKILNTIYEEDFKDFSHGYRAGRGARNAALKLRKTIQTGRFNHVLDADITGFFDNIDHDWMIRMLELRIADQQIIRLIKKWLKAGILEEDGKVINPITGTPQGGVISAVLANIYLHYALDLWFEKRVKPNLRGDNSIIRYADDFVCCFQYASEAETFQRELKVRLEKFGLTLSEKKTKLIKFSPFKSAYGTTFQFLGFDFRWGKSRNSKALVVMRTAKKKLLVAGRDFKDWLKKVRCKKGLTGIMKTVRSKLHGHYNYYGVTRNFDSIQVYYKNVIALLYKWLNRRSQRKSYNWNQFSNMLEHFELPTPRIVARWW